MTQALIIAMRNFKNFAAKHTLIFFITMISLLLSTVTAIYVTVKLDGLSDYADNADLDLNYIRLENEDSSIPLDEMIDKADKYCSEHNDIACFVAVFETDGLDATSVIAREKQYYENCKEMNLLNRGRYFEDSELENGDDVVLAVMINEADKRATTTVIDGHEYTTVGYLRTDKVTNKYIPLNSALKYDLMPINYEIYYKDELDLSGMLNALDETKESFPEFNITNTIEDIDNAGIHLDLKNSMLILMAIISLISCAYMYSYILGMRLKQVYIFKICGASPSELIGISLTEIFVIMLIQFIPAALISRFVIYELLKENDYMFCYTFSLSHILFACGIICFCAVFIYLPMLFKTFKKTAVQLRQERK